MQVVNIAVGTGAFIGVSWVVDKFILKKEFDPKQTVINALIVLVILGITAVLTKKTGISSGKGLLEVGNKIAEK